MGKKLQSTKNTSRNVPGGQKKNLLKKSANKIRKKH